jgi:hypothetical protein
MTKALTSELTRRRTREDLIAIAVRVVYPDANGDLIVDESAVPILGDAVAEAGWHHICVMATVLRFELEARIPSWANDVEERKRQHEWTLRSANNAWEMYAGKHPAWAKAVLAALLFGEWSPPMKRIGRRYSTRSPWALVRKHVTRVNKLPRGNLQFYSSARVFMNRQELGDVSDVNYSSAPVITVGRGYAGLMRDYNPLEQATGSALEGMGKIFGLERYPVGRGVSREESDEELRARIRARMKDTEGNGDNG